MDQDPTLRTSGWWVQVLPESLTVRTHVDSSRWCSTTVAMTGARGPSLSRTRELGSARIPNPKRQGSIPWRPAHVVLASRTANAGRKPKRSWVKVPETTPSQRPGDLDDGFISRAGCGSSPPAATKISGCSEVVSRCVRDAETAGSIPVTPTTFMPRARESAVRSWSNPGGAPLYSTGNVGAIPRRGTFSAWRTVHLAVMAPLQDARGRSDSDVLYDTGL